MEDCFGGPPSFPYLPDKNVTNCFLYQGLGSFVPPQVVKPEATPAPASGPDLPLNLRSEFLCADGTTFGEGSQECIATRQAAHADMLMGMLSRP